LTPREHNENILNVQSTRNRPCQRAPRQIHRPRLTGWKRQRTQAIEVCGGDVRDALKAMIVANEYLESEIAELMRAVSHA
jgi:hypothetical protein